MNQNQVANSSDFADWLRKLASGCEIVNALYPNKEFSSKDLVKVTSLNAQNISKALHELENLKIISIRHEKNPRGGHKIPFVKLTDLGQSVYALYLTKLIEGSEKQKVDVGKILWKVEQLWDLVEDKGLEEGLRNSLVQKLFPLFDEDPVQILEKSGKLKSAFKSIVEKPPVGDFLGEKKRILLVSMPRLLSEEKTKDWALSLTPNLEKLLYDENLEVQEWAIRMLGNIARLCPPKTSELTRVFVDKLFSPTTELAYESPAVGSGFTNPYKGPIANALLQELRIQIFDMLPESEKIELLNSFREKAKSEDGTVKLKAEWMLRSII
ncbi:MAG: hypothetical protein ABSB40_02885 [Nitrososphaeria archaeon]|jgi:predicted transcriptional regulator